MLSYNSYMNFYQILNMGRFLFTENPNDEQEQKNRLLGNFYFETSYNLNDLNYDKG